MLQLVQILLACAKVWQNQREPVQFVGSTCPRHVLCHRSAVSQCSPLDRPALATLDVPLRKRGSRAGGFRDGTVPRIWWTRLLLITDDSPTHQVRWPRNPPGKSCGTERLPNWAISPFTLTPVLVEKISAFFFSVGCHSVYFVHL